MIKFISIIFVLLLWLFFFDEHYFILIYIMHYLFIIPFILNDRLIIHNIRVFPFLLSIYHLLWYHLTHLQFLFHYWTCSWISWNIFCLSFWSNKWRVQWDIELKLWLIDVLVLLSFFLYYGRVASIIFY